MTKRKNSENRHIEPEICGFCKKEIAIVNVVFKGDGLFNDNEQMNVCANCRDNLDDDIKILTTIIM